MTTWNINGVKNKLENVYVQSCLCSSDIVFLNEIKTTQKFHLPGYTSYISNTVNPYRGGCAILLKNNLVYQVVSLDLSHEDQIRLKLKFLPNVTVVGCYIPPSDSPYFSMDAFASIQELMTANNSGNFLILGDINSRFGRSASCFIENKAACSKCLYLDPPDPIKTPNSNAKLAITALNNLVSLNKLTVGSKVFRGALTYRQGR